MCESVWDTQKQKAADRHSLVGQRGGALCLCAYQSLYIQGNPLQCSTDTRLKSILSLSTSTSLVTPVEIIALHMIWFETFDMIMLYDSICNTLI